METDNIGAQSFLLTDGSAVAKRISRATWVGLFLSLLVMLLVRQAVSYFWPTLTFTAAIWKETLLWVSAITTPRRTITSHIDWTRHISLVEVDSLGPGHRRRLRCCRWGTGCAHRVRPRSRVGCI